MLVHACMEGCRRFSGWKNRVHCHLGIDPSFSVCLHVWWCRTRRCSVIYGATTLLFRTQTQTYVTSHKRKKKTSSGLLARRNILHWRWIRSLVYSNVNVTSSLLWCWRYVYAPINVNPSPPVREISGDLTNLYAYVYKKRSNPDLPRTGGGITLE